MDSVISKLIPIFILAFAGFIAGRFHILQENTSSALCNFLFYFCAPAVSFSNIITSDITEILNVRFVAAMIVYELIAFFLLFFFYKKVFRQDSGSAVISSICSFYGNISYVGIPVFLTLFNNIIPNTILILIHGTVMIPLVVFLLDLFTGAESKSGAVHALKSTVKNPNIFVPIIAIIILLLKIPVPKIITDSVELLGRPTTSAGMFALGLTCSETENLRSAKGLFGMALLSSFIKLVVCPAAAWMIGKYVFALSGWWLNSMVILAMLPAALNDFIYSKRYHRNEEFASIAVLMSTLLFSVTISLYIVIIGL